MITICSLSFDLMILLLLMIDMLKQNSIINGFRSNVAPASCYSTVIYAWNKLLLGGILTDNDSKGFPDGKVCITNSRLRLCLGIVRN